MNKHADLIRQYAEDWAETRWPWFRWQFNKGDKWQDLDEHPEWSEDTTYRRKPRTININGIEVPEPVREPMEAGQVYYVPMIGSEFLRIDCRLWGQSDYSMTALKAGLVHLTADDAELHRNALLSFTEVRG